jgi:hypothetical protein
LISPVFLKGYALMSWNSLARVDRAELLPADIGQDTGWPVRGNCRGRDALGLRTTRRDSRDLKWLIEP